MTLRTTSLAGTCWELRYAIDEFDRVMLVVGDDGSGLEVRSVYLLHGDPEWDGHEFPYSAESLLEDNMWRRIA